MKNRTVRVYDTATGEVIEIKVSQDIYDEYTRTCWNIHDNNESFFAHEIQFSQLIGGNDGAFENFGEFITEQDPTFDEAVKNMYIEKVLEAVKKLKRSERELIRMIYFENMSEHDCARHYGISCKNINKKKVRILSKLYKLIKK